MPQTSRPTSDAAVGSWTTQAGGTSNLYQTLDETSPDEADFVQSVATPDGSVLEFGLTSALDPLSSIDHGVSYRIRSQGGSRVDMRVSLRQGASTEIAAWQHDDVSSTITQYDQTLTAAEADAITDYSTRRLRIVAVSYPFRDLFLTDQNPLTATRTAEPGPGTETVTGTGLWWTVGDALRGGSQPSAPAWGSSKVVLPAQTRAAGLTFVALVIPMDGNDADFGFGWVTGTGISNPRTDGHMLVPEGGHFTWSVPGTQVTYNVAVTFDVRPMQYLFAVCLRAQGAFYLVSTFASDPYGSTTSMDDPIGIPQYPSARLMWVGDTATTTPMYPAIYGYDEPTGDYPNGHFFSDARVVPVAEWSTDGAIATLFDRVTRANSTTVPGGSFTADVGTWGVSSNKLYLQTYTAAFSYARAPSGLTGDGIWRYRLTFDTSSATAGIGVIIRAVDASNFIRVWTNNSAAISFQSWVGGAFDATIVGVGFTWTVGQTYDIVIVTVGAKYRVFIDNVDLFGSWVTDSNARHLTGTGFGPYSGQTTDAKWDDFACYPHTVTLPDVYQMGDAPNVWTPGATLANDTFTGTDGTSLDAHTAESGGAWTERVGNWSIESNRATTTIPSDHSYATQNVGVNDYESSIVLNTPVAWDANGRFYAGLVVRCSSTGTFIYVRTVRHDIQPNVHEIELWEVVGDTAIIGHKVQYGNYYQLSSSYTLKVQVMGDRVQVFMDGYPRLSHVISQSDLLTGTHTGPYRSNLDSATGVTFDTWTVKAIS